MTEQRMVKGSVLVDFVKVIQATKHIEWDKYLLPEDLELTRSMVIPSNWYPMEAYQRMGLAVWKLVAGENEGIARTFGKQAMQKLLDGPYRRLLKQDDPHLAMQKFMELRQTLFNFSDFEMQQTGERSIRVTIKGPLDYEGLEIFTILVGVHFEVLVEANLGRNVVVDAGRSDDDNDSLVYEISWED